MAATESFFVPARLWELRGEASPACPDIDAETRVATLRTPGWQYARGSFFVMEAGAGMPLEIAVSVPDGMYRIDVGVIPVGKPPWLFGFDQWLRRGFHPAEALDFVSVGQAEARKRVLTVALEETLGFHQRLLTLRLTPPGATPATEERAELRARPEYRERLRALGYVQ